MVSGDEGTGQGGGSLDLDAYCDDGFGPGGRRRQFLVLLADFKVHSPSVWVIKKYRSKAAE